MGDHIGHGKGLARSGHPEQRLMSQTRFYAINQLGNRLRLIAGGLKLTLQLKCFTHTDSKVRRRSVLLNHR